jgi:UDP-glucose 4-epimerase
MELFITGGSGFIATPLVERLLKQGHKLKNVDIHPSSISHPNLMFIKKSILDNLTEDIRGCDRVYHFAALLGVDNSDKKPLETMRVNLEGSVNVFKCALEAGVKDIIYISSSEVYGQPRELPIKEESVKGPVSTYGVSKLAAEIYAKAFVQEKGANIKIIRFFNVYGERQAPQFVVPIFASLAIKNQPMRVFGDGSQSRCYTYVQDAVEGILVVAERGLAGEAYNIGNDKPTTVLELAKIAKEAAHSSSEISVLGYGKETRLKEREIEYRVPDITKMRLLGWSPQVMIREGMGKVVNSLKHS